MIPVVLGFDVYGTLVDPLAMSGPLAGVAGERASSLAARWRTTQIEYAFRPALASDYVNFSTCTRQALRYACAVEGVELDLATESSLLAAYLALPPFPEAGMALDELRSNGVQLFAFSNGTEDAVRTVLANAGLLHHFDDVVSVDSLRTFKPDPAVYRALVNRGGRPPEQTWLISANGWDVIGAKTAGLSAAWVRRNPAAVLDPWDVEPDVTAGDLRELADWLLRDGVR